MSSSTPLLTTKLYLPLARRNLVLRPRLTARLSEGLTRPLTLISAPAGYGKTTLLSEWRASESGRDFPLAWLSLDEGDNDTACFLTYLIAALAALKPGVGDVTLALLQMPQPPPPQAIFSSLIQALSEIDGPFAAVLDDYHVITARPIHEAVGFLLDHLPPQMRLVVLTRADPPLPLARLRAHDQLTEIRAADLRFTTDETAAFLNRMMGLALTPEQVAALEQRTEGWIAGLQLAALSAQGRSDLHNFVAAFAGSHRYIVDYLTEEVLNRQPEALRDFLLRTSILDRLCGELCDAVMGISESTNQRITQQREASLWDESRSTPFADSLIRHSHAILDHLDRANLFVIPLDDERRWYRYHPLFADMLSSRLRQIEPERLPDLHRRAGEWCEQHGLVDAAIQHALAAQDWSRAVSLMGSASQAAMRNGEVGKLLGWARTLPEGAVCENLTLCINYAWAAVLTGQFETVEKVLTRIESAVQGKSDLQVDWLAVRVYAARAQGEMRRAMELAHQALAISGTQSVESQCILALSLAMTYWHSGRLTEADAMARRAVGLAEEAGNWHVWAFMMGLHARIQASQGYLHQAAELYRRTIAGHPGAPVWLGSGIAQSGLAALHYEWNDLPQAATDAQTGLKYGVLTGHSEVQMSCHRLIARIGQAQGDSSAAWQALDLAAETVRKGHLSQMMIDRVAAERAQVALLQGDVNAAAAWLAQVQGPYGAAFHYPHLPLERAMLSLAQGDKAGAAALLAERYQAATQDHLQYAQIEIRTLQALAASDDRRALAFLADALTWAEPEGYVRTFVDRGPALAPLLHMAAQRGVTIDYIARLLAALCKPSTASVHPAAFLIEPLSARELEVLRLAADGCSNQEIADTLILAVGTVKRHLNNIFGKLNVQNRTQCVARARELNLLR